MKKLFLLTFGIFFTTFQAFCQTNVAFTSVYSTSEQAVQLNWSTIPQENYQIQYANALATNSDGSTAWSVLYDDYPAQGTNTFFLDCGNYNVVPNIIRPKFSTMRFYRILDEGQDGLTNDEPTVSITSPTSGSVVTGQLNIAVSSSTDQAMLLTKLFVDGEPMNPSYDGTNYTINTCEWANGQHTLFIIGTAYSTSASVFGSTTPMQIGHAVSTFVPILFSNLVTSITFSQPYFQPSLGQTQQVSAYLVANSDWTLTIQDNFSNEVRTVTGQGNNLLFNWDGTSDTGTNVPAGIYYYYISATTNGLADALTPSETNSVSISPPTPEAMTYAVQPDSESVIPAAIIPPQMNTNGMTFFTATPAQVNYLRTGSTTSSMRVSSLSSGQSFTPNGLGGAPSGQNAPASPDRHDAPVINTAGHFAVGLDTYLGNGINGKFQPAVPTAGVIPGAYVTLEGMGEANPPKYSPIPFTLTQSVNFSTTLGLGGWFLTMFKQDDDLTLAQLKGTGSNNPFNAVDFAIFFFHGVYGNGTYKDMTTGKSFYGIYFPVTAGGGATYLRMSDFNLGGPSPTNGLKWVCLSACTSLYPANWNSMNNQGIHPYNSNLHMILGSATDLGDSPTASTFFAQDMTGIAGVKRLTIQNSWYDSNTRGMAIDNQIQNGDFPNPTKINAAYDSNCSGDYLQTATNTVLSGTWMLAPSFQVYPPQ